MKQLYLAATGQNRGKTTASLGLFDGFVALGLEASFMKPVGQRTVIQDGVAADEDAVLMRAVFGLDDSLSAMSPVHIPRGFTKAYIAGEVVEDLPARIRTAHATFADRDLLLIEGTGHAGVGAVIGLSNAAVAALVDAPAIIVSGGGVGRPIDEIVLNASHFRAHGVTVAGAIVNKVDVDAQPGIAGVLERGLAHHDIALLGVLPYRPILSHPTLAMIAEGLDGELLSPGWDLDLVVGGVAIGAMEPGHMLEHLQPCSLVIVPGDREDVLLTLATSHLMGRPRSAGALEMIGLTERRCDPAGGDELPPAGGLVLTGGYRPRPAVVEAIRRAGLFALLVEEDTYAVASSVHDLLVKTHAADREKIALIKSLVAQHLDVDRILRVAAEAPLPIKRPH